MATKLSAAISPYHHSSDTSNHRPLPFTTPLQFPTKRRFAISCNSAKRAPPPPFAAAQEPKSPSLAEQLKPLSTTILSDQPNETHQQPLFSKPKSTWVNPTKPKPSVLSLQRHKRSSSYSYNPEVKDLRQFAKKLNDCEESDFLAVVEGIPHSVTKENALLVLNSLKPWPKALLFFNWVKSQDFFPMETIFYNVTMKCLRFGRQFKHIEDLAFEMIEKGIDLDNITYSTIITCAKKCNLFNKAIEWFERMYKTGLMPDEVTYSAVLDVYAKLGKVEEVISLYERGTASGWKPDPIAFAVLGKMYGEAGDYDGIRYVLQEMKSLGVQPNLVVYNTLLEAMGKAGNCLIDICRNRNCHERAHELLYLGTIYGLYPGLHTKTENDWRLNVRSLSTGAAHIAFEEWMGSLAKIIERQETLPALFSANTGAGTHKFSQGLGSAFASHVEKLAAPFRESEDKAGFIATREDLISWVQSRAPSVTATT
ncbi:UNVERIFIED_CONTAM: Pentatricopeptide repeat-containing protein, chloroplastic [Sesamum latifolium]|uniref:Pentatricopeptide repeat-containing protein, chloroplastic n=1 Tax=Sesamum latifolium TaxID=2727402 RepID=A0AAW2SLY4_9LAMI